MNHIETPASAREFIQVRNRAMDARRRRSWCCRVMGQKLGIFFFKLFEK